MELSGIPSTRLQLNDLAPDFDLPVLRNGVKERFHLHARTANSKLVIAFYPLNWEEISARQLIEYQARRNEYTALHAEIVTVSVDSIMNITAWEREIGPFDFLMCSDFWPHGDVCRRYGVFREAEPHRGTAERAVFVLDNSAQICFHRAYPKDHIAPFDDVLETLRKLV